MDDFTATTRKMYEQWEKSMGAWWDQVLESPSFLDAMGKGLEGQARAKGAWADAVDDGLSKMHLPTRGDLVRVARIATLLEEKVLAVEDTLLRVEDRLVALEKEVVQARIEAAEARIEARERLDAIQARLDALAPPAAAPAKPARRR